MARISLHLPRETDRVHALRTFLLALSAAALTLALVLASGARGAVPRSGITLGPVSVGDGTAVVTGSVGGEPDAAAALDVNGQPVRVDASGHFAAEVDLDGASVVVLTLASGDGRVTVVRIPLTLLRQGGDGVLDDLEAAGISLVLPPDGFRVVDGVLPTISGRVRDGSKLAGLTINGRDVRGLAGPNRIFSLLLPGDSSSQQVTVVATDHQGVSETTVYPMTHVTSVVRTTSGTSVSAAGARGVVIARIRLDRHGLLTHRRLCVIVRVRDRRGYLVRGAALRLRGMPARYLANGAARAGFTNLLGVQRFEYRLQMRAFGDRFPRRLTLIVQASTPSATARKVVRARLPLLPAT